MVYWLIATLTLLLVADSKWGKFLKYGSQYNAILIAILEKKYIGYRPIGSDVRTFIIPKKINGKFVHGQDVHGGLNHLEVIFNLDNVSEVVVYSRWWELTKLEHSLDIKIKEPEN